MSNIDLFFFILFFRYQDIVQLIIFDTDIELAVLPMYTTSNMLPCSFVFQLAAI